MLSRVRRCVEIRGLTRRPTVRILPRPSPAAPRADNRGVDQHYQRKEGPPLCGCNLRAGNAFDGNPLLTSLEKKHLNKEQLEQIFFEVKLDPINCDAMNTCVPSRCSLHDRALPRDIFKLPPGM